MTYVAQSASASFNPAHRLIDQTTASAIRFKIKNESDAKKDAKKLYEALNLPNPGNLRIAIRTRYLVVSYKSHDCHGYVTKTRPNSFDEPTTALDVTTQVEVLTAMKNIVKNLTQRPVYITHDLAVVAQMADV